MAVASICSSRPITLSALAYLPALTSLVARTQAAGDEFLLVLTPSDTRESIVRRSWRGFTFLQNLFGGLPQFGRDAQRGKSGGFHQHSFELHLRCSLARFLQSCNKPGCEMLHRNSVACLVFGASLCGRALISINKSRPCQPGMQLAK
ncbi:MAG: hypothetical protein IPP59_17940 [Betaproteobacteria bacterium]|nr:hypothetical protein [Candidatus Dechloromonas phosphorivorans]